LLAKCWQTISQNSEKINGSIAHSSRKHKKEVTIASFVTRGLQTELVCGEQSGLLLLQVVHTDKVNSILPSLVGETRLQPQAATMARTS
jgi:hypothetical protein